MLYLLQTDISFWSQLFQGIEKYGLGVVLSIAVFYVFYRFLNRSMKMFQDDRIMHQKKNEDERKMFVDLLQQKDIIIMNHLDHLTNAVTISAQKFENCSDKIVNSIDSNSKLFVEILNNCPLRRKDEKKGE